MAEIIDFRTRVPLASADRIALFEIINPPDPAAPRVLVDGLVPRDVARRLVALCEEHNAALASTDRAQPVSLDAQLLRLLAGIGPMSLSLKERAGNYAPRVLKRLFPHELRRHDVRAVEAAMRRLLSAGRIERRQVGKRANRQPTFGFAVTENGNVFD